jgi:flagellar biosynthetic protein FlhB
MSSQGDRTEKPTAKRLKDTRERGQVARSRDLSGALSFAAAAVMLGWFGVRMMTALAERVVAGFSRLGEHPTAALDGPALAGLMWNHGAVLLSVVGPVAAAAGVVSIGASVTQTGWVYSSKVIRFDWNRLNPATGFGRLAPQQASVEVIKSLIGMVVVCAVCYGVIREFQADVPRMLGMSVGEAARYAAGRIWMLLWRASLAMVVLAAGDFGVQYWRWSSQTKMTRQEVRDEARSNEGSPEIKARVRKIQREMTRRRMLNAVKTATVVVTNPTHFAVALTYRRSEMAAPIVVAKGQDQMAARIRAVARKHGVPIVENVSLARALHKTADIGDAIPAALFSAVAEVLAYLVRIKQLFL